MDNDFPDFPFAWEVRARNETLNDKQDDAAQLAKIDRLLNEGFKLTHAEQRFLRALVDRQAQEIAVLQGKLKDYQKDETP